MRFLIKFGITVRLVYLLLCGIDIQNSLVKNFLVTFIRKSKINIMHIMRNAFFYFL